MTSNIPRGIRNNNPLNIVISKSNWIGKKLPNTDGKFEQFTELIYGFRAAFYLIRKYIQQGDNTIEKIVSRWSPDGNERRYIHYVSSQTSIPSDYPLSFSDRSKIVDIVSAMASFENGAIVPSLVPSKAYDLLTK